MDAKKALLYALGAGMAVLVAFALFAAFAFGGLIGSWLMRLF